MVTFTKISGGMEITGLQAFVVVIPQSADIAEVAGKARISFGENRYDVAPADAGYSTVTELITHIQQTLY